MATRAHNAPFSRFIVLSGVSPLTSGGSLQLANGQPGLFKTKKRTANGMQAVADLAGANSKETFQIQVGTGRTQNAGNQTNKNIATIPFTKDEILDVTYSPAKDFVLSSVTLGYNGVAGTGISLKENEATTISLSLKGDALAYLGFRNGEAHLQFSIFGGSPDVCEDCADPCSNVSCKSITDELVERIREHELRAGSDAGTGASFKVGDIIDVIPNISCTPDLYYTDTVTDYTLTLCDGGTQEDLGRVQAQYPSFTVTRDNREGTTSTYKISASTTDLSSGGIYAFSTAGTMTGTGTFTGVTDDSGNGATYTVVITGGSLTSVTVTDSGDGYAVGDTVVIDGGDIGGSSPTNDLTLTITAILPDAYQPEAYDKPLFDCACPTGYTSTGGGHVYLIELEDDGADQSTNLDTAVTALSSVTSAVVTKTGQNLGVGSYIIVTDAQISDADLATWVADPLGAASTNANMVTYEYRGEVEAVCVPDAQPSEVEWVVGDSCIVGTKSFYIDLKDTECGASRLAELQAAYPELSISEDSGTDHDNCRRRYTTSVTSDVVCEDCETPDFIFEAPDDFEFESWNAVAPAAGSINSFTLATSMAGVTDGTYSVSGANVTTSGSGTGATFSVTIASNEVTKIRVSAAGSGYAVGDTVTLEGDAFTSGTTPADDVVLTLTGVGGVYPTDCECGITFKAKETSLCPPAMLADSIGTFTPSGVRIQVSGGEAPTNLLEGYKFVTEPFKVTRDAREFGGTGWGCNLMRAEKEESEYFLGIPHTRDYAEGYMTGFETKLEPCSQYDFITLKVKNPHYSGTPSRIADEDIRYVFIIEQGSVCSYASLFNALGGDIDTAPCS